MKKTKFVCKHCSHSWVPRKEQPKKCPNCRKSNWASTSGQPFRTPGTVNSVFPGLFR